MFSAVLKRIGYERRGRLANPSAEFLAILGADTTDLSVTPLTALRSPTALACVRSISETAATLPVHLYRRGQDGSKERIVDHPAAQLLAGDPNPWSGRTELMAAMQTDALLHGHALAQVVRAGGEPRPRELHRLSPGAVTIDQDSSSLEIRFKISRQDGSSYILPFTDALFIPTPGWTPDRPLCILKEASHTIGLDIEMQKAQGRLFRNGTHPAGVVKHKLPLSPEAKKRLRDSLKAWRESSDTSGGTLVLDEAMDFEPHVFNSVDAQFLELRRHTRQEIAAAFKIPLTFVGDLDRAVWRNLEQLVNQYLTFTMLPWLEVWKSGLERSLLTPDERRDHYFEFLISDLTRADIAARFVAYRSAAGGSWLSPNEVRALENLPPIEGGDDLILQAGQSGNAPQPPKDDDDEQSET